MNRFWHRFLLWLRGARAPRPVIVGKTDAMCRDMASHYVDMGPLAAGSAAAPSPGSEQLLARARMDMREQFDRLIPAVSRGIAASSASRLAAGAAGQAAERRAAEVVRAQARSDAHMAARPQVPRIVNRIASNRAFRFTIASACVVTEMVITSPSLEVLSHGKQILGLPLEDVLAFLLGLLTFLSAEIAAECFVTWLQGRRVQRSRVARRRRWLRRRRPRQPRVRGATGRFERAAGLAAIAIVVSMVALLSWFISVREHNNQAAENIREGAGSATGLVLPGLPLGGGSTGAGAPGGPIQGLGGPAGAAGQGSAAPAGPITLGGSAADTFGDSSAKKPDTEGKLGPVGALSIVAFLIAFTAASLAGVTEKYTSWRRRRRQLGKELAEARAAHELAQRAAASAGARSPHESVEYDAAARFATTIVERNLARATRSESRIRELYLLFCRRAGVQPVGLVFPPHPDLPDELSRLLMPPLVPGQQVGGTGFGVGAVDAPQPVATPLRQPEPPPAAGEPHADGGEDRQAGEHEPEEADADLNSGPPRARPAPEDVQTNVRRVTKDMREPREERSSQRRGGRLPRINRRRRRGRSEEDARVPS